MNKSKLVISHSHLIIARMVEQYHARLLSTYITILSPLCAFLKWHWVDTWVGRWFSTHLSRPKNELPQYEIETPYLNDLKCKITYRFIFYTSCICPIYWVNEKCSVFYKKIITCCNFRKMEIEFYGNCNWILISTSF